MNNASTTINRVAGLTVFFWIVKILSTTVGETVADFVNVDLGVGLVGTTILMGVITIGSVIWDLKLKKYYAPAYWFLIVMMSIEGTLISDLLVDGLGVSLITLDVVFTIAMLAGFYLWYKEEGTLSIHKITNDRREIFYWLIVLITFALGTAVGDTVSEHLNFGYLNSLMLFGGIFVLAGILFYMKMLDGVTAFWLAFIVTRPVGASLGDLLIQAPVDGGFGISAGVVNTIFLSIIIAVVAYLTVSKVDVIPAED
ncbi:MULTISPECIES: membrane protein [unclassified Lebetimonas]|uniref:COG4705 family protein n=1 Tax=unclassified Lebetimonas TaxID=2648158 RepID=UPI000467D300|nr:MULTISPECIES: membrane protein [unclassified Lebetimonas]